MSKKKHVKKGTTQSYETPSEVLSKDCVYPKCVTYDGIVHTRFNPMGFGHELQTRMTKLFHQLVMEHSDLTMAEMGYLHQSSILFEDGRIKVRMYFHPELATYREIQANGNTIMKPIPQLGCMNGYFFILTGDNIDLNQVIGFDKILIPKFKIEYDELGKQAVRLKRNVEDTKLQEVMYVECNLPITVAACMDLSLADSNYRVSVETVGQTNNPKNRIIIDGKENSFQVWVDLQFSEGNCGFDPGEVVPYLLSLVEKNRNRYDDQKKLAEKAEEKTEKNKKKSKKASAKFM